MSSLQLSLVSHTNAGKTTLARTLLGRDVGEVRDAPHVTEFADAYEMLRTPAGETLRLWDTPGFGDSVRLLRRMQQSGNPLGWFLSQVWDRWRDRPFWASQQALRHVAETSDVVLYLVSAAEQPEAAAYVASEMALLRWVGKPVIVLLNQLGAPREGALEQAEAQRWREHLAPFGFVTQVLPLDAFARCWVQELVLLQAIEASLQGERRALMQRLGAAWRAQRLAVYDASVDALAQSMARLALAREELAERGALRAGLRKLGAALGLSADERNPTLLAQAALAEALDAEVRASTTQLIELHGLAGQAQGEILQRLARHYQLSLRMDESKAALIGGALTGALVGLKADIAAGGLTLGGGLLAGGLLGALGAAGLARAVNLVRGTDKSWIAWNAEALDTLLEAALLRYLAVAHFGRGRGEWARAEAPPHWQPVVEQVLADEAGTSPWQERGDDAQALAARLPPLVDRLLRATLQRLYPLSPVP
ncbi:MAG TPA: GTPase domain-containing protein [Rubrivivax sp.]|nr:GTPase domain-containing protein [Rubrivivax sp.]